jgi:hypothetical protein
MQTAEQPSRIPWRNKTAQRVAGCEPDMMFSLAARHVERYHFLAKFPRPSPLIAIIVALRLTAQVRLGPACPLLNIIDPLSRNFAPGQRASALL